MKLRIAAVLVSLVTVASVGVLNTAAAGSGGPSTPVDCRTLVENPCLPQPSAEPQPVVTSSPTELADAAGNTENEPYPGAAAEYDAKHTSSVRLAPAEPTTVKTPPKASVVEEKASSGCN